MTNASRASWVITATFFAAYVLTLLPGPAWFDTWRPNWVTLVLIYWCLATPARVGIGIGWLTGLIFDLLYGAVLGQYALAGTVIAYLAVKIHLRVRMFPLWQQAVTILVLLIVYQILVLWVRGALGEAPDLLSYWFSSFSAALIWPWLFLLLRRIRRRAQISG